ETEEVRGRNGRAELPGAAGGRDAPAAVAEIVVLHFRQRRKLRLQRRRFCARQGWKRCRDNVQRSRGLRQIGGKNSGRIARRNFLPVRLLRGKELLDLFRRRGWGGEDSP